MVCNTMLDENMITESCSSEESEGARRRRWRSDVRECYSAEWAALRRKGSHRELELEWAVLSWDRESPGQLSVIIFIADVSLSQSVGVTTF